MKNCGHESHKECAWANTNYHPDHPHDKQYGTCYHCQGLMNKGAYEGEQPTSKNSWNIEHIDSNPKNNSCKNLTASHPKCNRAAG